MKELEDKAVDELASMKEAEESRSENKRLIFRSNTKRAAMMSTKTKDVDGGAEDHDEDDQADVGDNGSDSDDDPIDPEPLHLL